MFSLQTILKSASKEIITPISETKNKFDVPSESSFVIVNNGKAIVGINSKGAKNLILETLNADTSQHFETKEFGIAFVRYDESTNTLFAGGYDQKVTQYKENNGQWEESKDFGNVGISYVYSSTQIGDLIFFGGMNGSIRVLNTKTGETIGDPVKTSSKNIFTLMICYSDSNIFLSIGGLKTLESPEVTDFFNITLLCEKFGCLPVKSDLSNPQTSELQNQIKKKMK